MGSFLSSYLNCEDCAADKPQCGWVSDEVGYDCGTDGQEDPSGELPYLCEDL